MSDLDQFFGDTKYVFTTEEDGQTVVKKLTSVPEEEYYNKIIKNVAIGAGVILVCVVITVATEGAGAPAAAAIFAASAKTAATCALSGMVISGVSSGLVKAYQTGDLNESLKAAAVSGSEGFKWGAIGGAVSGGAREAFVLSKATANGLSLNDVARIQNESGYPLELIREFHTMDEYTVFRNADLFPYPINGQTALIRADIDPYLKDEFGVTNLSKMLEGKAPISNTGETFELHHIGQNNDGILAILTSSEHDSQALHGFKAFSEIDRNAFAKIRSDFWKSYAELIMRANG